jgi:hypothetical protein
LRFFGRIATLHRLWRKRTPTAIFQVGQFGCGRCIQYDCCKVDSRDETQKLLFLIDRTFIFLLQKRRNYASLYTGLAVWEGHGAYGGGEHHADVYERISTSRLVSRNQLPAKRGPYNPPCSVQSGCTPSSISVSLRPSLPGSTSTYKK